MPIESNFDKNLAIEFLRQTIQELQAVFLNGGVIREEFKRDSDVDIAVKTEVDISNRSRWSIQEALASKLNRNVDLLVLGKPSLVIEFEVVSTGEMVVCSDQAQVDLYETTVYSRYWDFNSTRKAIIEAIVNRGAVYGG
ncbi:MAG: nucleotidyltransferase domain-containing protein [Proteobacteria bacterium]|nr:nucleotidyltransferase domain-containing protein [Pseudomonadota bacterium]